MFFGHEPKTERVTMGYKNIWSYLNKHLKDKDLKVSFGHEFHKADLTFHGRLNCINYQVKNGRIYLIFSYSTNNIELKLEIHHPVLNRSLDGKTYFLDCHSLDERLKIMFETTD